MGKPRKDTPATKNDVSALKSDVQVLLKRLDKKIDGVVVELIKTQGDVREIKESDWVS